MASPVTQVEPAGQDTASEPLLTSTSDTSYGTAHPAHSVIDTKDIEVVHFSANDPEDPRNWPRWRKWLIIGPIVLIDLSVSWGASGFSPASRKWADDFGLPAGQASLGLSAYVLGLGFGPMTL
jgi:hypothetical protein